VDLREKSEGDGFGCEPRLFFVDVGSWYYHWVPPESGTYWILAAQEFHGFYILKANKKWYDCKRASVSAYAALNLYQYFDRGTKNRTVIDKEVHHISESGFLNESSSWSFVEYLGGEDQVIISISFEVCAMAYGSGSYAEINFCDGKANYVNAPAIFIIKS
jgi:hypothetical protein